MLPGSLELLFDCLACDGVSFVLGAGASAPHVPTLGQIPTAFRRIAARLGSFPASPIPDSPLRQLIQPLMHTSLAPPSPDDWKAGAMTSATIAVLLEEHIARAHRQHLPQYKVFRLFPITSSVVSFNWDGLACARCPQTLVLQPHGTLRLRPPLSESLEDRLDYAQGLEDSLDTRRWLLPNLVLPGEEEAPVLRTVRERVLKLWLVAPAIIIIGYSFGMSQTARYDRIWLDIFIEAMTSNKIAPVHIISPSAAEIRGELAGRLRREINVFAWPLNWYLFACSVLRIAHCQGVRTIAELRPHADAVAAKYRSLADAG